MVDVAVVEVDVAVVEVDVVGGGVVEVGRVDVGGDDVVSAVVVVVVDGVGPCIVTVQSLNGVFQSITPGHRVQECVAR